MLNPVNSCIALVKRNQTHEFYIKERLFLKLKK